MRCFGVPFIIFLLSRIAGLYSIYSLDCSGQMGGADRGTRGAWCSTELAYVSVVLSALRTYSSTAIVSKDAIAQFKGQQSAGQMLP